ncbi:MAG: sugar phosphorylase, partial [Pirellulales bacterium]
GTTCIHLPKTHTVVRLMREVLSMVAPGVWLLSETNVPHKENISYFGAGDEAQLVYQFSLPPLLLDAYLNEDAGPLTAWLPEVCETLPGTTFFNFTASHDGIGVRPLEGLVSNERIDRLVEAVKERGGAVSTRKRPDGSDSPYELNISYLSALGEPGGMDATLHARRFLASQAIMLALRGIPGIYFHSLVGTPNDVEGWKSSGIPRRINRHRYEQSELETVLANSEGLQSRVLEGYRQLLKTRIAQAAFHPEAQQRALALAVDGVFGFVRQSVETDQQIVVLANLCGTSRDVDLAAIDVQPLSHDLLSGQTVDVPNRFQLEPYQVVWLESRSA